jgi:DNA polymerase-3 subunit alpha
MRRMLTEMKPSRFEHVAAAVALYRPGPMEYIGDYIRRLHGEEAPTYRHSRLEPILAETFGILTYQEQIISVMTDLAGYSLSEADLIRRAVGKKKKGELLEHRKSFIERTQEHSGISQELAAEIFDDIEPFARYGFNRSHAVNYAAITCQTAYLKAVYPAEYMAALLSVERNNTEKLATLLGECRRLGLEVLSPDVNTSESDFVIEDQGIRFGLGAVKNVGDGAVDVILNARRQDGPFMDLDAFCQRVDLRQVNRRALECLIKVGALDVFGHRAQLLTLMDRMMALSQQTHLAQEIGQLSMFDSVEGFDMGSAQSLLETLPVVEEAAHRDQLSWEKELVGVYLSEHPLQRLADQLSDVVTAFADEIQEGAAGRKVTLAGVVSWIRPHVTRRGDSMAFVQLEDLHGVVEVVVFPSIFKETEELWKEDRILIVQGRVDDRGREPKVICESVRDHLVVNRPTQPRVARSDRALVAPLAQHLHIIIQRSGDQAQDMHLLGRVHEVLHQFEGQDRFSLYLANGRQRVQLDFPNDTTGYCSSLAQQLTDMLGQGALQVD